MSRRKIAPEAATPPPSTLSNAKLIAVILLASAIGAGIMWMLLPTRQGASPNVSAGMAASSPSTASVLEPPPSVAGLPPGQAALLLGHWHYDRQRWTAAVEQYETALSLGIDNPDVRTDLGNCYRFLGQPIRAREQYERSQRQNPQHENSLFNLATLHAQVLHDSTKARELLNEYLRRFPASEGAARARQVLVDLDPAKLSPEKDRLLRQLANDGPTTGKP